MADPRIPTEDECVAWEEFLSDHNHPYEPYGSAVFSSNRDGILAMADSPRTARVISIALTLAAPWIAATAKAYRDAVPEEVWKEMNRKLEIGLRKVYEDEIARYAGTYQQWAGGTAEPNVVVDRPDPDGALV